MGKQRSTFLEFKYKEDKKKPEEFGLTYEKNKAKDIRNRVIEQEDEEKKLIPYLVCPLCSHHQPLKRTGVWRRKQSKNFMKKYAEKKSLKDGKEGKKVTLRSVKYIPQEKDEDGHIIWKETSFGKFDFKNSPFISIRQAMGKHIDRATGKEGLPEVDIITLAQVKNMSANDKVKIIPIIEEIRNACNNVLEYTEGLI